MQALLAGHTWDWKVALASLQRFIFDHFGGPEAILVLDETAGLKKGARTVGVVRQHAGITGRVENCQTVVNCAYVTGRGHALFDFRLCLPRSWCHDGERRDRAKVPATVAFATKTELGTQMVTGAITAGAPFGWVAGDEVYGRSSKLRRACEKGQKGYVFAVPCDLRVQLHPRRPKVGAGAAAALVPATGWQTRPCGHGCKGHRDCEWAWMATASPRHWLLLRRKIADPSELAFFYCHAPAGQPMSVPALFAVTGKDGRRKNATSRQRGRPAWTSTRYGSGSPFTAIPCCPCAPWRCSPLPPPARSHPPRYHRPQMLPRRPAPSPPAGPAPGSSPPARTSRRRETPAWSRSASRKPAACCAWPPRR